MASAVLFQGFHGSAIQMVDVVVGFLIICAGVILLQLAKSSKDVPDAAVFKGDLDQVRTVAEQEESEYDPRADTIRGGAGIVRAMSRIRTQKQVQEARRLREESLAPVNEGEEFEWDGLRRRKTVSSGSGQGSVKRTKTVHPPLGMTHFPDDISEPDADMHPGFFGRIGRKSHTTLGSQNRKREGRSPVPLGNMDSASNKLDPDPNQHTYGLPPSLQKPTFSDTEYRGAGSDGHIHFANDTYSSDMPPSRGSLAPPQPPPHAAGSTGDGTKRTFSFQDVFHRKRSESREANNRPTSRGALSFISGHSDRTHQYPGTSGATEEERLGLVFGDSTNSNSNSPEQQQRRQQQRQSQSHQQSQHSPRPVVEEAEEDDDDEWQITPPSGPDSAGHDTRESSRSNISPHNVAARAAPPGRRGTDPFRDGYGYNVDDDEEMYDEPIHTPTEYDPRDVRGGRGRGSGGFI